MSEYCYKCGQAHTDMGTAGCPRTLTGLSGLPWNEIAKLRAENAALRSRIEAIAEALSPKASPGTREYEVAADLRKALEEEA